MRSIYADRVYSEHPIGLWSVDAKYTSFIDRNDCDIFNWNDSAQAPTVQNYIGYVRDRIPSYPGPGEVRQVVSTSDFIEIQRNNIIERTAQSLDVGFWVFSAFEVNNVEISLVGVEAPVAIAEVYANRWTPVSVTFPVEDIDPPYGINIRFNYLDSSEHYVLIGSIMVGEEVGPSLLSDLGSIPIDPPPSTGLQYFDIQKVVPVKEYGFGLDTAYVVYDNQLMAKNQGIPMVYGDNSSTHLVSNENPCFIVPGKGTFHNSGKYRDLTLEFWTRVKSGGIEARLIGPLASQDGIWISNSTICLVIGDNIVSHDVGDTFKPLLINVAFSGNSILLRINGDDIGSVPYSNFPSNDAYNTDWIGVYCPFELAEIGPIAIFPYVVSSLLSKRHFIWGQATEINTNDTASFARPTAKYYNESKVILSEPLNEQDNIITSSRFGRSKTFLVSSYHQYGAIPLSSLSKTYKDAGDRTLSTLNFIQFSSSTQGHKYYLTIQSVRDKGLKAFADLTKVPVTDLAVLEPDKAQEVIDGSLVQLNVKYPHLYTIIVYVETERDSLMDLSDPEITLSSVAGNDFQEIGTVGNINAFGYRKEGPYYIKGNAAQYVIHNGDGSALALGNSGMDILYGGVQLTGRRLSTFMGLQLWVKFTGEEGSLTLELNNEVVNFDITSSTSSARLLLGDSTLDTTFTFYQDGIGTSSPRLFRDTWTSIGIALDEPVEMDKQPRLIINQGLTFKNIVFYGGDSLSKLVNFRTWGQLASLIWDDIDEMSWQEVFTLESSSPAMNIGRRYLGTIGANRFVVGDNDRKLHIVDDGVSIMSKAVLDENEQRLVLSVPSWKTVGQYA